VHQKTFIGSRAPSIGHRYDCFSDFDGDYKILTYLSNIRPSYFSRES